jgi:hypothetical protein
MAHEEEDFPALCADQRIDQRIDQRTGRRLRRAVAELRQRVDFERIRAYCLSPEVQPDPANRYSEYFWEVPDYRAIADPVVRAAAGVCEVALSRLGVGMALHLHLPAAPPPHAAAVPRWDAIPPPGAGEHEGTLPVYFGEAALERPWPTDMNCADWLHELRLAQHAAQEEEVATGDENAVRDGAPPPWARAVVAELAGLAAAGTDWRAQLALLSGMATNRRHFAKGPWAYARTLSAALPAAAATLRATGAALLTECGPAGEVRPALELMQIRQFLH